jgi:hypothetical protein
MVQRSQWPFWCLQQQVQGSKQQVSQVRCQQCLHLPGTQYCSQQVSLTLRVTVLQVVTGTHTVLVHGL